MAKKKSVTLTRKQVNKILLALEKGMSHIAYTSDVLTGIARQMDTKDPAYILKDADSAYDALNDCSNELEWVRNIGEKK